MTRPGDGHDEEPPTRVVIDSGTGEIALEVLTHRAPRAASYFLERVASGAYDGSSFYRSTRLDVPEGPRLIQAGPLGRVLAPGSGSGSGPPSTPPLLEDFETTADSGLLHEEGVVSLARDLLGTGHVLPEFFLCLGRFPQLDFEGRSEPDSRGFPALGRGVSGLEVVEAIASRPTGGPTPVARLEGEILSEPVPIHRMRIREA